MASPTSEYGVYPQSALSGSSPEHIQPPYHPANITSGEGMAQQQNGPSMPQQDRHSHQTHPAKSDNDVPIDPSIARGQNSPSAPNPGIPYSYSHPQQARQDWAGHGEHVVTPPALYHRYCAQNPASAPYQTYEFVDTSGVQQLKRHRRRYEEIERMYKCGWNGCEKAYGTLNHLNAHVTMQSHGQKREPEEFNEIRREWKQRKKEEEANRKAEEERQRQAAAAAAVQNGGAESQGLGGTPNSSYPVCTVQLPPVGYQPAQYPPPPHQQFPLGYNNSRMYYNYQPHSPYAQPSQGMSNLYAL